MKQILMQALKAALIAGLIVPTSVTWAQDEHSSYGHQQSQTSSPDKPWSQADQYFDPEEMNKARTQVQAESGGQTNLFLMADRLETQIANGEEVLLWDGQGWYGGDINKLWIKTEGEYSFADDTVEDAEIQALWSRAISPYFDFQAGLRYDIEPDSRAHGVIGLQGLAPQWFEVDAAAFLSDKGDLTARIEAENDLLLTQRLILQPRLEVNFSAQNIPERNTGSGITSLDAGVRLRYEIVREFAPYVGVEWQKSIGKTATLVEAAGGKSEQTVFVAGLRLWF